MPDHEEWLALGRVFEEAERRSRDRATALADHLFDGDGDATRSNIAGTYLEGRAVGWDAYARDLGVSADVSSERAQAWAAEAQGESERLTNVLVATVEDRGELTRAFIDNYAVTATSATLWTGIDTSGIDIAALGEAQWKTWVRSWARKKKRDWHSTLEGVTIPIEDFFTLPGGPNVGAQVDGPRDWEAVDDAREHINCGHALRFLRSASAAAIKKTVELGNTVYEPPAPAEGATPSTPARRARQARRAPAAPPAPPAPAARERTAYVKMMDEVKEAIEGSRGLVTGADRKRVEDTLGEYRAIVKRYRQGERGVEYETVMQRWKEYESAKTTLEAGLGRQYDAVSFALRQNRNGSALRWQLETEEVADPGEYPGFRNIRRPTHQSEVQGWRNVLRLEDNVEEALAFYRARSDENLPAANANIWANAGDRVRAFADRTGIYLDAGQESTARYETGVIIHELAHVLEYQNDEVNLATLRFRSQRTGADNFQRLADLNPGAAYSPEEIAKPDDFFNPYVGRWYRGNRATEILSMGMQELYYDPVGFFDRDPEHFELIVAIANGRLRESRFYADPATIDESTVDKMLWGEVVTP